MELRLTIDGQDRFNWAIAQTVDHISDFRGVWPEIEMIFFRAEQEQFNSEGARGGGKWAPISDNYRRWKEKHYPGRPILVLTGRLKRSLSVGGSGGSDQVRDSQPKSLTLGTLVPYARYHQRGTKRLVARPPLEITQRDMGRMTSRIYRFAERGPRDAGFKTSRRAMFTPGAE